jgi:hypothetical protein
MMAALLPPTGFLQHPRVKLQVVGTANRLNVEHRTFNFERPVWMALRFIYVKPGEPLHPLRSDWTLEARGDAVI